MVIHFNAAARCLPFEHILQFHIFVGYLFCTIMVLSVVVFFIFFGKVCSDHLRGLDPVDMCRNFSREIMFTGYGILIATLVILSSSFFRARLPYEVFYWLHVFFVLAMFSLATLHTLDDEFRAGTAKGKARSQAWRWFVTSLVTYGADRMWSYTSMRHGTVLKAELSYDEQTIVLYVRKPAGLQRRAACVTPHPPLTPRGTPSPAQPPPRRNLSSSFASTARGSWTKKPLITRSSSDSCRTAQRSTSSVRTAIQCGGRTDRVLAIVPGPHVPLFSLMWERARRLGMLRKEVLLESREQARFLRRSWRKGEAGGANGALK